MKVQQRVGQLFALHALWFILTVGPTANGFGPSVCGSTANITNDSCCDNAGNSNGTIVTFGCNSTATCCSSCQNDTRCTTWTLDNSTNNCTLHTTCAHAAGNCTRGEMPPAPSPPSPGPRPPPGGLSYNFVATWRGLHKKEGGDVRASSMTESTADATAMHNVSLGNFGKEVGDCTCSLIAPSWIITAEHCAERVLKHEKVDVKINFHGDNPHVERSITHCIRSDGDEDVAICHLTAAVHAFPPVAISPIVYTSGDRDVITIGTKGGLHEVGPKKLSYEKSGAHLYVKKGGGMKAGDSGGPWVIEAGGHHYLVGVLHGSGIAGQPSYIRKFLDNNVNGIIWAKP